MIIVRGQILTVITEKEIVFGTIIVNGYSHLTFTALWFRIFCVPQFRSEVGIPFAMKITPSRFEREHSILDLIVLDIRLELVV